MIEITSVDLSKKEVKTGEKVVVTIGIQETVDYPFDYPYDYPIAYAGDGHD